MIQNTFIQAVIAKVSNILVIDSRDRHTVKSRITQLYNGCRKTNRSQFGILKCLNRNLGQRAVIEINRSQL